MFKPLKKIIKSQRTQEVIAWFISLYLKFVYKTSSWEVVGLDRVDNLVPQSAVIACFWHGRMAMIPFMWRWPQKKAVALISGHADGMMVAQTFKRLNVDYTTGSTNRGGARAFLHLLKVLERQDVVVIIPDGPRGPAKKLTEGIIRLAEHSQAPIVPLAYAISRHITFNSWDKFQFPLPFSKGVFIYGEPISTYRGEQNADDLEKRETYRLAVEQALCLLQDEADQRLKINRK